MSDPVLRIFSNVLGAYGSAPVVTLAMDEIDGWQRSIRGQGGYWQGDFSLSGEKGELSRWFHEFLGYHVVERSQGLVTWEGIIYELELSHAGSTRRRSLDDLYNDVYTRYTDAAGSVQTTAGTANAQSIARYGTRQQLLLYDNIPGTAAAQYAASYLEENAWPWPRAVGLDANRMDTVLNVTVCGYVYTANWKYENAGDGSEDNVSDWIGEIVAGDCEYLQAGAIEPNYLQVDKETTTPERAWDVIEDLTGLGDGTVPWQFQVLNDRRAYYHAVATTPQYYWINGELCTNASGATKVNPWNVRPGVVRDMTYPVSRTDKGAWMTDARDMWITEVSCGTGAGLVLRAAGDEEGDLRAAQAEYMGRMSGGGWNKRGRLNWKRQLGYEPGTQEWEAAEKMTWAEREAAIKKHKAERRKRG